MKRLIALMTVMVMMLAVFVGCSSNASDEGSTPAGTPVDESATEAPSAEPTDEADVDETATVEWPTQAVTVNVAAKAGGFTDMHARYVTTAWDKLTSESIAVINFDGRGIAVQNTLSAKADGYTFVVDHNGVGISILTGAVDFSFDDITVVAALQAMGGNAIITNPDAPYDTIEELIAYATEHPAEVSCAMQTGSASQFMWAMIEEALGVDLKEVECSNEADKLTNVAGGFINLANVSISNAEQYEEAGKLKVLGVIDVDGVVSEEGTADNWKTLQEQGYDVTWGSHFYIFAPAGIDDATAEAVNASLEGIINDEDYVEGMKKFGATPEWRDLAESRALWESDIANFTAIAKVLGFVEE